MHSNTTNFLPILNIEIQDDYTQVTLYLGDKLGLIIYGSTDVAYMAVKKNHKYSTHLENIYEQIFQNRFNYLHIISFSLPENLCGTHKRHGVPTAGGDPDAGQPAAVSS